MPPFPLIPPMSALTTPMLSSDIPPAGDPYQDFRRHTRRNKWASHMNRLDEQMTETHQYLTERSPSFATLPPETQAALTRKFYQDAMKPTKGENVQQGLEMALPPALAAGASIAAVPLAAKAGPLGAPAVEGLAAGIGGGIGAAIPEFTRPLLTDEPFNPGAIPGKMLEEGAPQAMFGFGGRAAGEGMSGLLGPLRQKMFAPGATSPETIAAREFIEPHGGVLSPAMLSREHTPSLVNLTEVVSRNAILSNKGWREFDMRNEAATVKAANRLINDLGTGMSEAQLGQLLEQEVKTNATISARVTREMHKSVDQLTQGGVKVDTSQIVGEFRKHPNVDSYEQVIQELDGPAELERLTRTVLSPPTKGFGGMPSFPAQTANHVTFENADELHSNLLRITRKHGLDDPVGRTANFLAVKIAQAKKDALTKAEDWYKRTPQQPGAVDIPQAIELFHAAKAATREGKQAFEGEVIANLVDKLRKSPEILTGVLLSTTSGSERVSLLNAIKKASNPTQAMIKAGAKATNTFDEVQRGVFTTAISNAVVRDPLSTKVVGLDGTKLLSFINKFDPGFVRDVMGPERAVALRSLANSMISTGTRATGPGKVAIALVQTGAGGTILRAPFDLSSLERIGGATSIILGPQAIGIMYRNPAIMKNIADGIIGEGKNTKFTINAQLRRAFSALAAHELAHRGGTSGELPSPLSPAMLLPNPAGPALSNAPPIPPVLPPLSF